MESPSHANVWPVHNDASGSFPSPLSMPITVAPVTSSVAPDSIVSVVPLGILTDCFGCCAVAVICCPVPLILSGTMPSAAKQCSESSAGRNKLKDRFINSSCAAQQPCQSVRGFVAVHLANFHC